MSSINTPSDNQESRARAALRKARRVVVERGTKARAVEKVLWLDCMILLVVVDVKANDTGEKNKSRTLTIIFFMVAHLTFVASKNPNLWSKRQIDLIWSDLIIPQKPPIV